MNTAIVLNDGANSLVAPEYVERSSNDEDICAQLNVNHDIENIIFNSNECGTPWRRCSGQGIC